MIETEIRVLEKGLNFASIWETLNQNLEKIFNSSHVGWDVKEIFEMNQLQILFI